MKRFHHLGFVSSSLESALAFLPRNSGNAVEVLEDHDQQNLIAIFSGSGTVDWFEVIVPLGPKSTVANHLNRNGPGLHHLAFEFPSIRLGLDYFVASHSVLLGGYQLEVASFGGWIETKFLSNKGVLIEIVARTHE